MLDYFQCNKYQRHLLVVRHSESLTILQDKFAVILLFAISPSSCAFETDDLEWSHGYCK